MTHMAKSDDIDTLVSSVRHLVKNPEAGQIPKEPAVDRLVLTPALRIDLLADETPLPTAEIARPEQPARSETTLPKLDDATAAAFSDGEAADDNSFDPDAWAASPFHSTHQKGEDVIVASASTDLPAQDLSQLIDQAALREMIVSIVQEELAGEMGERITHSVRKLVRREINRLLAAQELD